MLREDPNEFFDPIQRIIPHGTIEDVRREVLKRLEKLPGEG